MEGEEQQQQRQEHKVANLNCEKYGGPSNDNAQEMVYWEDIPRDALHISPFHHKHPDNTHKQQQQQNQPITQFLTFESGKFLRTEHTSSKTNTDAYKESKRRQKRND